MSDLAYPIGKFTWSGPGSAPDRARHIAEIAAAPAALRVAVTGLSDSQVETPYRPGGWTVRQVAHHVPDSHLNAYVRFKLAVTEDTPTIKPYDEAAWARLADVRSVPVGTSLALLEALLPSGDAQNTALRSLLGDYASGLDELPAKDLIANWKRTGVADAQKSADAMDRYVLFEGTLLDLSGTTGALELARQASLAPAVAAKDLAALALAWKGERAIASVPMQPLLDAAMTNLALSLYDGARTLGSLAGIDRGSELARFYTDILARNGDVSAISSPLINAFAPYHKERAFARGFLPAEVTLAWFAPAADLSS